jgi:hypothetical protein
MAAKAAIYGRPSARCLTWVPAFAGMTQSANTHKTKTPRIFIRGVLHFRA